MTYNTPEAKLLNASDARFAAQRLAFGPLVFHATIALRDLGILQALMDGGDEGVTINEIAGDLDLSRYAVTVLLESGLGAELVTRTGDRFRLTKVGYFVLHDDMTRVNLNFVRDICYRGAADLITSLKEQRPAGLQHLGHWRTIYEGIGALEEPARASWFDFDHYYSSSAFPDALSFVFTSNVQSLLDVGGNTGKWAVLCAKCHPGVHITVLDDAPQVEQALARAEEEGVKERVAGLPLNLLDHDQPFPGNFDVVWMSQLLSCFSQADMTQLLRRSAQALKPGGKLFILETFWDRQKYFGAAYNLQQTSLYFASIANGVSRIYDFDSVGACVREAGLHIQEVVDGLGVGHTLLVCSP